MKKALFALCAVAALSTVSAFADFVPGRVRPGMIARLEISSASGIYSRVREATLSLNYQDDKSEPVSMTLSLDGRSSSFPIRAIRKSGCGDSYEAAPRHQSHYRLQLELKDFSRATCERVINKLWEVRLERSDIRNGESVLFLQGNPEPVIVTL